MRAKGPVITIHIYPPAFVLNLRNICLPDQRPFSWRWVRMPFRRKTQFSFPLNEPMFLSSTSSPNVYFGKEMAFEVLTSWKLRGRGRHCKHLKVCPHFGWNMAFFKGLITVFGIHGPCCSFKVKKTNPLNIMAGAGNSAKGLLKKNWAVSDKERPQMLGPGEDCIGG